MQYLTKSEATKAILVLHVFPDLEAAVCCWLIKVYDSIVRALGFDGVARVKFVPSGPLRVQDFDEFGGCVDHETLYKKWGVVFIDCGYGKQPLDQHRQDDRLNTSSMKRAVELGMNNDIDLTWLAGLEKNVSDGDLYASETSLTTEEDYSEATPYVGCRDLRKLIFGLNLVYPNDPETVVKLIQMALNGVAKALPGMTKPATDELIAEWAELDRLREAARASIVKERKDRFKHEIQARNDDLTVQYNSSLMKTLTSYGIDVPAGVEVRDAFIDAIESGQFGEDGEKVTTFFEQMDEWYDQAFKNLSDEFGLSVLNDKEVAERMGITVTQYRKHYNTQTNFRSEELSRVETNVVKRLFAWSQVLGNVRKYYASKPAMVQLFEQAAEAAFVAWNNSFARGKNDYFTQSFDVRDIPVGAEQFPILKEGNFSRLGRDKLDLNIGISPEPLYGKAARDSNRPRTVKGKEIPRPYPELPERYPTHAILQIVEWDPEKGSKYLISTKGHVTIRPIMFGVRLQETRKQYLCLEVDEDGKRFVYAGSRDAADRMTEEISRRSDLHVRAAGIYVNIVHADRLSDEYIAKRLSHVGLGGDVIILDEDAYEQMRDSGNNHITVKSAYGGTRIIEVTYLTDFLSSGGRAHNTNPYANYSPLTPEELVTTTIESMCRTTNVDRGHMRRMIENFTLPNLRRVMKNAGMK